jgi:8-oxo-dGTP pyrophosphatase MutT (NUDIX family)
MLKVKSCGVIVFRRNPHEFLLMRHHHRYDLPKGHVEAGETDIQCALRELWEETGIPNEAIELDDQFRYEEVYYPREPRFGPDPVEKTLVMFLGWVEGEHQIAVTEHVGHEWRSWQPPHKIQRYTVDPLLKSLTEYFERHPLRLKS